MKRRGWTLSPLVIALFLIGPQVSWGQDPEVPATTCEELCFNVLPSKQLFSMGEGVVIVLELYSRSEQPFLLPNLQSNEFVRFKLIGPDGNEVRWQGELQAGPKRYSPSDFILLGQYKLISANRNISLKEGGGFVFDKPGQYSLTAEFSMGPAEELAPFIGQTKTPVGSQSAKLAFCIEACILQRLPVRNNAPPAALSTVRSFYIYVTKYGQLGIPYGPAKKALWPLLSKRLAQQLDSLEACDEDYYRRYGEILRANSYKPATPWLDAGLFTGPNDAATPRSFRILSSKAIGAKRVDVLLKFTTKQTYSRDLGLPPSYEHYEGVVTIILENNRWVVDDYVAMYMNDELERLSDEYPQCKEGQWVGEPPY
jgi:hypothetical protein